MGLIECNGSAVGRVLVDDDRTVGQCGEKPLAVRFAEDTGIEDDDDPVVVSFADQPAEALFEFDHGFRELVFEEGRAASLTDRFEPGFDQRMIGD